MLRYVDEILISLLFAVLHSGRAFFDLKTRKMKVKVGEELVVYTFGFIQEILIAIKAALGENMQTDQTKLDRDGSLMNMESVEKKA